MRVLQADDPLAEVTVLVPSNTAGLSIRRLIGAGTFDEADAPVAGIINVSFATPFQLAATLAAPTLASSGQRPLTTAVLAAATRHVLRAEGNRFASVAGHVATEMAIVRAYAELSQLAPDRLQRLAEHGSPRTIDLVALVRAIGEHLRSIDGGLHDEAAVFAAATSVLRAGGAATNPSLRVVFADPLDAGPAGRPFLRALASVADHHDVVAVTGDAAVDRDTWRWVHDRGPRDRPDSSVLSLQSEPRAELPLPDTMIPAADADDECRVVVRRVIERLTAGTPAHRIAVFHPIADPYARTLREHFEAARVPTAGPDHRTLADSMVGRLLRRLIDIAATSSEDRRASFDRATVLALVESGPLRGPDGRRLRAGSWESISRQAGVVGGLDDWRIKLTRFADVRTNEIDDPRNEDRSTGWIDARRRERAGSLAMLEFVEFLHEATSPDQLGSTWRSRADWATGMLDQLLPPVNRRTAWPEQEVVAAERIEVLLGRVSVLDTVDADGDLAAFIRAVDLELDGPAGSRGRFGSGVHVGPLAGSIGLDFDHVFIVGLAEGTHPRPIREDTLLPDDQRALVEPDLARRSERLLLERRRHLHAVAAGTVSTTVVAPMGDARNGRERTVSRWWLEALRGGGAAETVTTQDWRSVEVEGLEPVRSFSSSLIDSARRGTAMSKPDAVVADVLSRGGAAVDEADCVAVVGRGIATLRGRTAPFGRHNGHVPSVDSLSVAGSVVSASRLETWAQCPRRYLFGYVLGLGVIEAPDVVTEISALERGSLVHAVLERFIADALPGAPHSLARPDTPWSEADRLRLLAHADDCFDEWEANGLTGRPLLWAIEKERLRNDLIRFLERDHELRSLHDMTPAAVELAIGFDTPDGSSTDPAVFELDDGRTVRFRGFADRIDRRAADGSPIVIDYKTGSAKLDRKKAQTRLGEDPVAGGTKLQLGVYAQAAMQHYGTNRADAHYFYVSGRGGFETAGYPFTSAERRRFVDALTVIVDGIGDGLFPPNPGNWGSFRSTFENCFYCDFDPICSHDRLLEHDRAVADERLSGWNWMKDPEPFEGGEW